MKVLMLLLSVVLVGCSAPDFVDKRQQDFACKDSGGVFKYQRSAGELSNHVRCNNGQYAKWYGTVIPLGFVKEG